MQTHRRSHSILWFLFLASMLFISCGDDNPTEPGTRVPELTTAYVSSITQTTAECGGTITSDGGAEIEARGVCWSTDPTPTVDDAKTSDSTGTGSFTSSITGLTANTAYYVAAYATNAEGTGYGSIRSFTTTQNPPSETVMRLTYASGDSWHSCSGMDSEGNIHIAWQDDRDGNYEIYYAKLDSDGNNLVEDTRLTEDGAESSWPAIDLDGSDNVHIIWRDTRDAGPEVYYTKLDSDGNTIVDDTRLTTGSNNHYGYDLVIDAQNNLHVVWVDYRDGNSEIYYAKLDNSGNPLVSSTRLTEADGDSWWPMLVPDGAGDIHVTWYDSRNGNGEIYYKKLNGSGSTIVDDVRLTTTGAGPGAPHMAVDGSGNVHIIWPGILNVDRNIYYTKLDNSGGTLVESKAFTSSQSYAGYWMELSGNSLHITWSDNRDGNDEIYYTELDLDGNTLTEDTRVTNNGSTSWWPRICVDNTHGFHIVWDDNRDGNREIYYANEDMIFGSK
jgi:hypothetical protein